ncbi:MAG: hypothetical protein ABIN48_15880, partial [Ginsengibacter sp.]
MNHTKSLSRFLTVNLFLVSAILFSCNSSSETDISATNVDTVTNTQGLADEISAASKAEAILSGTYPDTTLSGSATFEVVNGKVKMVLNITSPAKA